MKKNRLSKKVVHVLGVFSLILAACSSLWIFMSTLGQTPLAGCGLDSGCSEVLGSTWSKIAGIPLSLLGLLAYSSLLWAARIEHRTRGRTPIVPFLAAGIGLAAVWFTGVQAFVLGAFCPWCCATHLLALIGASLLYITRGSLPDSESARMPAWAAPVLAVLSVGALGAVQVAGDHTVSEVGSVDGAMTVVVENDRPVISLHDGAFEIHTAALPVTGAEHPVHWIVTLSDPTCKHCRELHTFLDEEGQAADTAYVHLPVARNLKARHLQHDLLALFRSSPEMYETAIAGIKSGTISDQPAMFRTWIDANWKQEQSFQSAWTANKEWATSQINLAMDVLEANKAELGKVSIPQMMHGDQILLGQPDSMAELRETFAMGAEVIPVVPMEAAFQQPRIAFAIPASTRSLLGGLSFVLLFVAGLGFYLLRRRRILRWVALFSGGALAASSVTAVLAAGTVVPENTIFIPQTDIIACVDFDGTADFSTADPLDDGQGTHTPGEDLNGSNNVVRTYDLIQYGVNWNVNEQDGDNVIVTLTLPPDPARPDDPDPNSMFINWTEIPSGCIQTNVESAAAIANKDSYISNDGKTLVCNLGDKPEGSSGTIHAIAQVGLNLDGKVITMNSTVTTDDSPPVSGNPLETTISGAPAGDWVKGNASTFRDITNSVTGESGWIFLYPIALIPGDGSSPVGSEPMASVPLTIYDHFMDMSPNAIIADNSWFTNRNACGGYDLDKPISYDNNRDAAADPGDITIGIPFSDPTAPGSTANNTISATIGCTLDTAATAANGYPVVRFDFSNYDGAMAPPLTSVGGPNTLGVPLSAQIAFWISEADLIASKGSVGTFYNAISQTDAPVTGVGGAAVGPPDPATIAPIQIYGSSGTVSENIVGDNNWAPIAYRINPTIPGKAFRHYTHLYKGPYQEQYSKEIPGNLPRTGDSEYRYYIDHRQKSRGGLGGGYDTDAYFDGEWHGTKIAARGETFVVRSQVATTMTYYQDIPQSSIHHEHINLCNHIDDTRTELVAFASPNFDVFDITGINPNTTVAGYYANDAVGGYQDTISDGPAFHVHAGDGMSPTFNSYNIRGVKPKDYPYIVEVAMAAPGVVTAPNQSVDPGAVTCDDADADPSIGWVAATNSVAMEAFSTVPNSGVYDKANLIRLRSLSEVPWRQSPGRLTIDKLGLSYGGGFAIHYNLRIKTDNTINPDGETIFVHASRASGPLTNGTFVTQKDDGGCGCTNIQAGDDGDGDGSPDGNDWGNGGNTSDPTTDNPPPGEQWCNLRYDFANEDPSTRGYFGTYDLTASDEYNSLGWANNGNHDKLTVGPTRLSLTKKNANGNPLEVVDNGDLVTFEICWDIKGSPIEPVSNLLIGDNLPANMEFVSATTASADSFTQNGQILRWSYANVIPGGTGECFTVTVRIIDAVGNQALANSAFVAANDFFSTPLVTSSTAKLQMVAPYEELYIYKTVNDEEGPCDVYPGPGAEPVDWADRCSIIHQDDDMEFTLHLRNEGLSELEPLDVIEVFPFLGDAVEPSNDPSIFSGDGRAPVSDFSGSLELKSWPPTVGGSINGTTQCRGTFYWTTAVPDTINRNPEDPSNALTGGIWSAGTPPSLAAVTGFRYVMSDNLGVGGIEECQIIFELDSQDNVDLDFYSNTFGGKTPTIKTVNRANDVSILVREFDLALTKILADPASGFVFPGQDVTFDIEVCNQGSVAAAEVRLNDYLPPGFSYVDADNLPGWRFGFGSTTRVVYDFLTDLDPGECQTIPLVLKVGPTFTGSLTNWAEIQDAFDEDGNLLNDTDSADDATNNDPYGGDNVTDNSNGDEDDHDPASVFVLDPCIDIEKFTNGTQSDAPTGNFIAAGDPVTWTYVVTNCGNIGLGNITVVDDVEGAGFYLSGDTDDDGILDTDEEWIFEQQGIAQGGQYSNTVQVSGDPAADDGTPIPGADPVTDEDPDHYFGGEPGISIEKTVYLGHDGGASCPGTESVTSTNNAPVTYCFVVENTGNLDLDPVVIMDTLLTPSYTSPNLGSLAPGGVVTVHVDSVLLADLTNVADVTGNPVDGNGNDIPGLDDVSDDDPAEVHPANFDLALQKVLASDGPFNPGDDITFSIIVQNQGDVIATSIQINDTIPAGLTLNDPAWLDFLGVATYTYGGPLLPGDFQIIPITFTIDPSFPAGPITNIAEIASAEDGDGNPQDDIDSTPDGDPGNDGDPTDNVWDNENGDEDDHDPEVIQVEIFDLALTKVIDTASTPGPYSPGDTITFIITVTNQGTMGAQDIDVVDYIPEGLILADPNWTQTGPNTAQTTIPTNAPCPPIGVDSTGYDYIRIGDNTTWGNPNPGDPARGGAGAVGYPYEIGRTEVTVADYLEFVNHVHCVDGFGVDTLLDYSLVSSFHLGGAGSWAGITDNGAGACPARYVPQNATEAARPMSFIPAMAFLRYANYVTQSTLGLPIDVDNGYYVIDTTVGQGPFQATFTGVNPSYNNGEFFRMPTADEYIKAAYYQGSGTSYNTFAFTGAAGAGYFVQSAPSSGPNDAVLPWSPAALNPTFVPTGFPLPVGSFPNATSFYGLLDASGNVSELIDPVYALPYNLTDSVNFYGGDWFLEAEMNTLSWLSASDHRGMRLVYVKPNPAILSPGGSIEIPISFTIGPDVSGELVNWSEIAGADDEDGNPGNDIDSTPDTEDDNDGPADDNTTDGSNGDEDDHDPAPFTVEIFDLALEKVLVGNGPFTPGGPAIFEITVFNQGTVTAQNVVVTDYVPAGLTVNDPAWDVDGTAGPGSVSNTIAGPIAPGGSMSITIEMVIDPAFSSGVLTNFSEIAGAEDGDGNPRDDDVDSTADGDPGNDGPFDDDETGGANGDEDDHDPAFLPVGVFDLALTKVIDTSVNPGPYNPGDSITYLVSVCNQGSIEGYNVDVVDYVPAGLILNDPSWTNISAGVVGIRLDGPIVPNGCESVQITFTIDPAFTGGVLTNFSEIAGAEDGNGNPVDDIDSDPDSDPGNDGDPTDDATANENGDEDDHDPAEVLVGVFDLALTKVLDTTATPGPFTPGDPVTFAITVTNQGTVIAQNIEVSDYFPAGLSLADPAWTQTATQTAVTVIPGPLAPGGSTTITITFTIDPGVSGDLTNWSEISEAEDDAGNDRDDIDSDDDGVFGNDGDFTDDATDDPNDEDDSDPASITVEIFDLALTKVLSSPGPFYPGALVDFTLTVENQGTVDAFNIGLSDYVPAGLVQVDPAWTLNGSAGPVTADLLAPLAGPLAPGATTNIVITLQIDPAATAPATLVNFAEINGAEDEDGPRDDEDSTPDNDPGNDGDATDDATDGENGDEDDHDPAELSFEIFDLALEKALTTAGPYEPGDMITFTITLDNQGTVDAQNILVSDAPSAGLILADPAWSGPLGGPYTYTYPGPLLAGTMDTVTITYQIDPDITGATSMSNYAEIDGAEDTDGNPRDDDIDSTEGDDSGDQDDDDEVPFEVEVFDLALTKVLDVAETPGPFQPGDTVTFEIEVFNQGSVDAYNVDIVDYVPAGLILADPDWTSSGPGVAITTWAGPILAGDSAVIDITFTIAPGVDGPLENVAEIESAEDGDGEERDDNDSTPDGDNGNDGPHDDGTTDNSNGDEDDTDPAGIDVGTFDLALMKVNNDPGPFYPGGTVTFDITVFNQGTIDAYDITVADYVPPGLIVNDPLWVPNNIPGGITSRQIPGPLVPGAQTTIQITFTIDPQINGPISITNHAEIASATDGDGIVRDDIDSDADFIESNDEETDDVTDNSNGDEDDADPAPVDVTIFDLALVKDLSATTPGPFTPGDMVTFVHTIENQGSVVAQNITITDTPPAGLILADAAWSGPAGGPYSYLYSGPLSPGLSDTVTITFQIDPAITTALTLENTSEIASAEDGDGNPRDDDVDSTEGDGSDDEDDDDPEQIEVEIFDLALDKVLNETATPGPYSPGDPVTFTITVYNQGTMTAQNIEVTDYIPSGLTLADPAWSLSAGNTAVTTIAGPLAPGASTSVDIVFTIDSGVSGNLQNFSEISGAENENGDPEEDIDSTADGQNGNDGPYEDNFTDGTNGDEDDHDPADVFVEIFDLALTKVLSSPGPHFPGGPATYTITLENQGTVTALNIDIADYIPAGLILMDPDWVDNAGTALTTVTGPLAPGNTLPVDITFMIDPSYTTGVITNFAEIAGAQDDEGNPRDDDIDSTADDDDGNDGDYSDGTTDGTNGDEDDHDPAFLPVGVFDLALTKTLDTAATPGPFSPGDDVTFTVTVYNQGTIGAQNVTVTDYIPAGLTLNDSDWSLGTNGYATSLVSGPIPAGGFEEVGITFTIDSGFSGSITNVTEISGAEDDGGNPRDDDIDSDPDGDPGNDGDMVDDETGNGGGDEDDSDPEVIAVGIFDLALTKVLTSTGPFNPGDDVTFTITVENQGTVAAQNIGVTDYIPTGLILNDPAWTIVAGGEAVTTVPGPLFPADTVDVTITFTIAPGTSGELVNYSEISGGEDTDGNERDDIDSTPDSDGDNDGPVTDGATDGSNGDEDDHDPAPIFVEIFDLALTKVLSSPGPFYPGAPATFTHSVENQGTVPAQNITLTDYVPAGLIVNDPAWSPNGLVGPGTVTTVIAGPVAPGAIITSDITFTIDPNATSAGSAVNSSEISEAQDSDGNVRDDDDSTPDDDPSNDGNAVDNDTDNTGGDEDDSDPAQIEWEVFDLAIDKAIITPGPYSPGDTVTYAITVINEGTVDAQNIALSDNPPAGLILADTGWSGGAGGPHTMTYAGPLPAGSSDTVTITYTIDPAAPAGTLENWVDIDGAEDTDGNPRSDDIDSTENDDSQDQDDDDPEQIEVGIFDLALLKDINTAVSPGPYAPGDTITFTITVFNQGTVTATDIQVTDYIPAGMSLADPAWTANGTSEAFITVPGPLAAGASTSVDITLLIGNVAGDFINYSEISGASDGSGNPRDDIDSDPDSDQGDDNVTDGVTDGSNGDEDDHDPAPFTVEVFDLALTKVLSSPAPYVPGDDVTFTITVLNQGTIDAYNVPVTDYTPAGLALNDPAWTETNGVAQILLPGPIPAGNGVQVDITYTIDPAFTTGQIVNYAEIGGGEDADGNPRDDIDSTPDDDDSNDGEPNDNNTDNLFGDEDDHDPAVLPVNVFDLALTKQLISDGPFSPGDSATFMITVYNQGSIPAQNVEITDSIPAGLILDDPAWTESGGVATTQLDGPIVPGGSENVTITFTIDPAAATGTLVNHAEISGAEDEQGNPRDDFDGTFDGDPANDTEVDDEINGFGGDEDNADPAEIEIGVFDLALTKQLVSAGPFDAGDPVTFEVTVYNQGTVTATGIEVTDYIPAGLTLADAAWTLVSAGEAVTTIAGPLAPGADTSVTITLTIDPGASGELVNFAEISDAGDGDGNPRDDIDSSADDAPGNDGPYEDGVTDGTNGDEDDHDPASISVGTFDLALVKVVSSPGPFTPGDDITFEITVINQGDVDAANIMVTDQLPAGLTLNDAAWTDLGSGLAEAPLPGTLAAGASASLGITATIGAGVTGTLENLAEISGATDADGNPRDDIDSIPDGDPANDGEPSDNTTDGSDNDEDDHDPAPFTVDVFDLALDKALTTPGPFSPGDQVTFTIYVSNEGTVPAANIAVTEHIPAGLVLDDLNWVDNGDGTAVRMVPGTLLPGVTFPLTVSFVIEDDASGQLVNIAEISAATDTGGNPRDDIDSVPDGDPGDPLAEDDHDPEPITVDVFDLALVKNLATPGPVSWGDTVTFEITVFNQGTIAAENIDVVDYIPAGLTLADAAWSKIGPNAVTTVPGPLAPGGMETVTISFTVDNGVQGELVNYAEITGATDTGGMPRDDLDSTPDADIANDGPAVDGVTDGSGGDEDDHDPASVNVEIGEVDLALTKEVEGSGPWTPGDPVTFRITLFNQGEVAAELVDIVDYIPAGLILDDDDWTDNGDGTAGITWGGPIVPGAEEVVRISFVIDEDFGGWLVNEAEITGATDGNGNPLSDIDGTLDGDPSNNGTPNDNVVTDPADTDHHDPAPVFVEIFDLALVKTVVGEGPHQTGDDLTFNIRIVNQGNTDATGVEIVDLLPPGLTLNDPDWTDNGDGTAGYTLAALAAGASADIGITTTIGNGVDGMVTNYAEIAAANGPDGRPRDDIDSLADSDFGNEGAADDNALGGTGSITGGDEDDADPAPVMITGLSTVTGSVWTDLSADGDPSNENLAELGLEGIEVVLYTLDEDGNPTIYDTVTTGPNGEYVFEDLPEGEYFISVDPEEIPDSISLPTTPNGYGLSLGAGEDSEANFGFTTPPTVVELVSAEATLGDDGVRVTWVSGFEQDTLGFNVYRVDPAGRTKVNDTLVIAGAMSYSVTDAEGIGGTYVLVEVTTDLGLEDLASMQTGIDAAPQGPGATVMAEDGEAAFTSTGGSYLVIGFDAAPTVLDVTVPDYPVELRGETLQAGGDSGAYFEAPAGASIDVRVAE